MWLARALPSSDNTSARSGTESWHSNIWVWKKLWEMSDLWPCGWLVQGFLSLATFSPPPSLLGTQGLGRFWPRPSKAEGISIPLSLSPLVFRGKNKAFRAQPHMRFLISEIQKNLLQEKSLFGWWWMVQEYKRMLEMGNNIKAWRSTPGCFGTWFWWLGKAGFLHLWEMRNPLWSQ